ncbi:MAG: hypothetical protein ACREYE_03250 [Gammaproteobacteria bacterium]
MLDQYKEKSRRTRPSERSSTSTAADYKEQVIDLLIRVTTVSVRTQEIVEAMVRAAC